MPGMRFRTIASPQRIPKIVFSGTATIATSIVSFSACTAIGFKIAAQNGRQPPSNARQKRSPTGGAGVTAREPSDPERTMRQAAMGSGPAAQAADREEHGERDDEQ